MEATALGLMFMFCALFMVLSLNKKNKNIQDMEDGPDTWVEDEEDY